MVATVLASVVATAGCGVRTPARIDLAALVQARGPVEARRALEVRIVEDPADLGARLALAELAESQQRPSQAIEQLEAVLDYGGPLGTRWRDADRARLGRLLAARGRDRLGRGAHTAHRDLVRAAELGATLHDDELLRARLVAAIARLRHVDAEERAAGKRELVALSATAIADPAWRGAGERATPAHRGAFGLWLWGVGAKRAAWEELHVWHAAGHVVRDDVLSATYLAARTWWAPSDAPPPGTKDLVGPQRCRYTDRDGCSVVELARNEPRDETAIGALLARPAARATTADEAVAWLELTLVQALRGERSWGAAFAARVDASAIPVSALPAPYRAAYARLTGRGTATDAGVPASASATQRLVIAAGRALAGRSVADVRAALGPVAQTAEGHALLAVVMHPPGSDEPSARKTATTPERAASGAAHATTDATGPAARTPGDASPPSPLPTGAVLASKATSGTPASTPPAELVPASVPPSLVTAVADHVRTRVVYGLPAAKLQAIAAAHLRDPAIGERLARDALAESIDAATAHASLGALYDALHDPARARVAWQAAVDASAEPEHVRSLAETMARANDPDAALVIATGAAAAWGDPAVVWLSLSRALERSGEHVHALEAARHAIDLAGAELLDPALALAIEASRSLRRDDQVESLRRRRALASGMLVDARDDDVTDARAALADYHRAPGASALARMWVASRWNPRDVALRAALLAAIAVDDPRRRVIEAELVTLARDPDPEIGRTAVGALAAASRR